MEKYIYIDENLDELYKIKDNMKAPANGSDYSQFEQYQNTMSQLNETITIKENKGNTMSEYIDGEFEEMMEEAEVVETNTESKIKKSKKKSKKAKNEERMTEIEVEIEEEIEGVESFDDLKTEMLDITKESSETLLKISDSIQLADVEKVEAINQLKHFIETQEELAKPYGIMQTATKQLTKLPWLGKKMEETYKDMKQDHLESKTIKEIVHNVYENMKNNGDIITERVGNFHTLRSELTEAFDKTIILRDKVKIALEHSTDDTMEQFELEKMLLSLNNQTVEFDEEIRNLKQIEVVTRGIAMKITENTPANKDRLLRKIAAFSTISEANNHLNEFKKLRDLTTSLDETIQESIFATVENVLDGEQQGKKELAIANKRAADYAKRAKEIDAKISAGKDNVKLALTMNTEKADQMAIEHKKEA